jgi:hypothetical protein
MRNRFVAFAVCLLLGVVVAVSMKAQGQGQGTGQGQTQGQAQSAPPQGRGRGGPAQNLQVLPKDWTTQQVQQFMRTYFTVGLGVECSYCHVGTPADRAKDDKPEKATARKMLKMVMAINDDFLKDVGDPPPAGGMKVTCYTCHRGMEHPVSTPPGRGGN